jgi:hypothetical protein
MIRVMIQRKMGWARNVTRMREKRKYMPVLVRNPERMG